MGKKAKIGKQRRDKAYWAAKEIGYRSRASFKLIQLNRKFEFLQRSRVCLDLCAAPGSWMQVAKEHMPLSSIIIGIDLNPIKAIPGCISLQCDITTEKCRSEIRKNLQGWKTDLVLHDGAPNVGQNWVHDAYQQSLLTLHSFKLATEFLKKGGTFVTKIFRSKDYPCLIWVFKNFFKNVHSTKPAASRNESAEIFVVCLNYKAPHKIDTRYLDPKHVFSEANIAANSGVGEANSDPSSEQNSEQLVNPEKVKKKPAAQGYDSGTTLLYKEMPASQFIAEDKPIHVLNNYSKIVMDEKWIENHDKTTTEIVNCCEDLKVLGIKELRSLKKWRQELKSLYEKKMKADSKVGEDSNENVENKTADIEASDDDDDDKLEKQIKDVKEEDKREVRRKAKRDLKAAKKREARANLVPSSGKGDLAPIREEFGLFDLKKLKSERDVQDVTESPSMDIDDTEQKKVIKSKVKVFDKEDKLDYLETQNEYMKTFDQKESDLDSSENSDNDDDSGIYNERKSADSPNDDEENEKLNPLLLDLDDSNRDAKREKKAKMWFDRDIFKNIENEEDQVMEEEMLGQSLDKQGEGESNKVVKKTKKPIETKAKDKDLKLVEASSDEYSDSSDEESDDETYKSIKRTRHPATDAEKGDENQLDIVKQSSDGTSSKKRGKGSNIQLTPRELAMGQEMISSKKRKRDILDSFWNRRMFDENLNDLPKWFLDDEKQHNRVDSQEVKIDPAVVDKYKDQQKAMNVKTVKKAVEAKARKKRKLAIKMKKAKQKANVLLDNPDVGPREKVNQIEKLYRKAKASVNKKKDITYVVAKKYDASKRAKRPSGVKGVYKQVDPRMKKDTSEKKSRSKRVQKRRLKGKKTRPEVSKSSKKTKR